MLLTVLTILNNLQFPFFPGISGPLITLQCVKQLNYRTGEGKLNREFGSLKPLCLRNLSTTSNFAGHTWYMSTIANRSTGYCLANFLSLAM